jgi:hypothetical protein
MKRVGVQCPHCRRHCECAVGEEIHVLLLHCPACHKALLHYYGQAFPIEDRELRHMAVRGHVRASESTIRLLPEGSVAEHELGAPVMDRGIEDEDIVNLRIDLARARDVNEFLSLL